MTNLYATVEYDDDKNLNYYQKMYSVNEVQIDFPVDGNVVRIKIWIYANNENYLHINHTFKITWKLYFIDLVKNKGAAFFSSVSVIETEMALPARK